MWIGFSYACGNDLCINSCNFKDLSDLCNQICSSYRDIIQVFPKTVIHTLHPLLLPEVPDLQKKIKVTFVLIPSDERTLQAFRPSTCHWNLHYHVRMNLCNLTSSLIMPSASTVVALTSPLIGPSTMDAISAITSSNTRPSFGDQGWICCNSTDHTHVICFFNILYICCVNKKISLPVPP